MASRLAGVLVVVLLLGYSVAAQQFHGVGASLTTSTPGASGGFGMKGSFGRGGFSTPGIPPSLTSITPLPPGSKRSVIIGDFGRRRHGHHGFGKKFVPIFVPFYSYSYPYYPYADPGFYPYADQASQMNYAEPEDQRPALTIFENRPGYRPPPVDPAASRDYARSEPRGASDRDRESLPREAEAEPSPAVDQTPTVLVFRDGHKLEIGNYAIQGDLLYNLDGNGPRKIKLAELDLDKTIQLNDERGNEFRLPKKFRG
ncbi:MAG: hypothetical protein L0Z53_13685 [Acidobacteriales bacterium]|nr:hypothetical protein [Terriglobales bacterium]